MPGIFPDNFSGGLDQLFLRNLPILAQSLARLTEARRIRALPVERLASDIAQTFGRSNAPSPVPPLLPLQGASRSPYFRPSRGQALAQMAAAMTRASRRYL